MNPRVIFSIGLLFFLPCSLAAKNDLQTPLEKSGYTSLSSHDEMMQYLKALDLQSEKLTLAIIGQSVEKRDIPALYFTLGEKIGRNREEKPIVLIYYQQHGNEPSGKEAALIVARHLAGSGEEILRRVDVILVPQVNPDGAEMGQRKNAHNMDLNRNHVILSEPESFALHRLFLQWLPEVTLDVHEYNAIKKAWIANGFVKDADEMLGGVTNLNIAPEIIDFSRSTLIPEIGQQIKNDGFRFHRYIVGEPFQNHRIRHSTTAINDGRQSMGIYNSLSFIIEGKRYGDLLTNIEKRTKAQVSAIMGFLKTVAAHSVEIAQTVRLSRRRLVDTAYLVKNDVAIQMDYFRDATQTALTFPVFDLYTWHHGEKKLENYFSTVKIKKSVKRPYAYVISADQTRLLDVLTRHQIEMFQLKDAREIEVTAFSVLHVTPGVDEDKPTETVDVREKSQRMNFAKGSVVILLNQKAANLIPLVLEPQSTWNLAQTRVGRKYRFSRFLKEGQIYPVFRIEKKITLNLQKVENSKITKL